MLEGGNVDVKVGFPIDKHRFYVVGAEGVFLRAGDEELADPETSVVCQ